MTANQNTNVMSPPHMLVIGGVYELDGQKVILRSFRGGIFCTVQFVSGNELCGASVQHLKGPTHVPCPFCGRCQPLRASSLQIDLAEHLLRCQMLQQSRPADEHQRQAPPGLGPSCG